MFTKRAAEVDGELRIVADPPVIIPFEDFITPDEGWEDPIPVIKKLISSYRRTLGQQHHPLEEYRYVHSAYKMVGVGSVGTRCYIMLMLGRDNNDPLFLQVKEAQASVLEPFVGKSTYSHHGQRVVAGQRLMQAATDIFLGWVRIKGSDAVTRDYYVRQFHDWKGGADLDNMLVPGATLYARICGATLARGHARWGDRIAMGSYLGKGDAFDRAIADFSVAYADQNEQDYEAFAAAVEIRPAARRDRRVAVLRRSPPGGVPSYAFSASCSRRCRDDQARRRAGTRPGGSCRPAGVARRPRVGDRRAQGRVRARAADQGRVRPAGQRGVRLPDLRRTACSHGRHPDRTGQAPPGAPTGAGPPARLAAD